MVAPSTFLATLTGFTIGADHSRSAPWMFGEARYSEFVAAHEIGFVLAVCR